MIEREYKWLMSVARSEGIDVPLTLSVAIPTAEVNQALWELILVELVTLNKIRNHG